MKALVIYDLTGKIWNIVYGEEIAPQGLTCMFVDIPDGARLESIDVTDQENPQPVFTYLPESDIGRLQKQMTAVEEQMVDMKTQKDAVTLAATFAAESFTDEQALQVPTLYPEWSGKAIKYKTGKRLLYFGVMYKVLQDHTSQADWMPDATPSLYTKVLIPDANVIPEWEQPESTNGYMIGDKVSHNKKIWESAVDNNVWEPGAIGTENIWIEVNE